ncbi:hypothetical protein KIH41_02785 [Litoribacter ruber]|uniref:TolB family protein n=1 Tax=Litoribacter ruber TaxID=702568 RepID=UPI001BDB601E|nr:hypothetical protein [Litoribacter ruber]MBT0810198.1 hypothetical protein [Litoribacter ruber]
MYRLFALTLGLVLAANSNLIAQGSTDIIAVETTYLPVLGTFKIDAGSAKKITDRKGYDNQPGFINDKQMVFSSQDDTGFHDIILYNFETEKFTNITRTDSKSEFSPSLTDCGQYISAVTVEEDSTQRLWLYPINMGEPEVLYDDIAPVGYYDWYDNKAAMFIVGQPHKLIYPYSRDEVITIAENIGRSIRKRPKTDQITYINKANSVVVDGKPVLEIMAYDLEKRRKEVIGLTHTSSEDFIWVDKNQILMAENNRLYIKNIRKNSDWKELGTVEVPGYANISRMAISPKSNKLLLVMDRQER